MSIGIIDRVREYELAAPGANTNILATSVTPIKACKLQITVVLAAASVFSIVTLKSGQTTFQIDLNEGVALAGDVAYPPFEFLIHPNESYNFRVRTNVAIRKLQVNEIVDA